MRRALILLAAFLVGIGGQQTAGATGAGEATADVLPATPATSIPPSAATWGAPEITAAAGTTATAFVRAGSGVGPVAWQEGSGPGLRPFNRRSDAATGTGRFAPAAATQTTLRTRLAAHRTFGSPLALERAGRLSCSATTPPPFRSV